MRFPRERVRLTQKAKGGAKREAESTAQSITSALSTEDVDRIIEHQRQTKAEVRKTYSRKTGGHVTTRYSKTNWVIKLSSRSLSDAEIALLKKGLNFSCNSPPRRLSPSSNQPSDNSTLNTQTLSEEMSTVSFNRRNHQSPKLQKKCETRLNEGRAAVVIDSNTYHAKMSSLIENGPYQLLNKDQTHRLNRKLSEKLLTLKRSGHLREAVYNKIRPRHKPLSRLECTVYRRSVTPMSP